MGWSAQTKIKKSANHMESALALMDGVMQDPEGVQQEPVDILYARLHISLIFEAGQKPTMLVEIQNRAMTSHHREL